MSYAYQWLNQLQNARKTLKTLRNEHWSQLFFKLKMPKGFESTAEKHWSFDLGNFERINVSWEPHGAPNLKKAESLSKILANAETVKSSTTLDSGFHEIERVREKDGFTFIVVFGPDWYVKCTAPAAHMDTCREIVRSKE